MSKALRIHAVTLGPFSTNCYVVWRQGGEGCWVIDASFEPAPLIEAVEEVGLRPQMLILTHAHVDHIAGVQAVRQQWPGIPVLLHESESRWLGDPRLNLSAVFGWTVTCDPADRLLREGETLPLDGLEFQVRHTPGHSPGGIALYQPENKTVFAGDTLFFDSIGRHDFPNSDGPTLLRSIREKLLTLPDETRVYPGHGPDTTIGRERLLNPFL